MKSFINQLREAQKSFIQNVKNNSIKTDNKTLTYKILDDCIKLSIEGKDKDGLFVECMAYIRTDNDQLYQSEIDCEGIFIRRP